MNRNYDQIKSALLDFGKRNDICLEEYSRLSAADNIADVIAVVKDNFGWCVKCDDFAGVLMDHRDQFAEHRIWINQDVEVYDGDGFILITEGLFRVESRGLSSLYLTSCGNSKIIATSLGSSTMNILSCENSKLVVVSHDDSKIISEIMDLSTVSVSSYNNSNIVVRSYGNSTVIAESYGSSELSADSYGFSTIIADSLDRSKTSGTSHDTSTMILHTRNIKCKEDTITRYTHNKSILVDIKLL